MNKCCKFCRYSYCGDETDVSGFNCEKNSVIRIINTDKAHELCPGFNFGLMKLLFWRICG